MFYFEYGCISVQVVKYWLYWSYLLCKTFICTTCMLYFNFVMEVTIFFSLYMYSLWMDFTLEIYTMYILQAVTLLDTSFVRHFLYSLFLHELLLIKTVWYCNSIFHIQFIKCITSWGLLIIQFVSILSKDETIIMTDLENT